SSITTWPSFAWRTTAGPRGAATSKRHGGPTRATAPAGSCSASSPRPEGAADWPGRRRRDTLLRGADGALPLFAAKDGPSDLSLSAAIHCALLGPVSVLR